MFFLMFYLACAGDGRREDILIELLSCNSFAKSRKASALSTLLPAGMRPASGGADTNKASKRALARHPRSHKPLVAFNPSCPRQRCAERIDNRPGPGCTVVMQTTVAIEHAEKPRLHRTLLLLQQLQSIHDLRNKEYISPSLQRKIGSTNFDTPTFKKLFTHQTWDSFTGLSPWSRWRCILHSWKTSSILREVLPLTCFFTLWAAIVSRLGHSLPMSPICLNLMGTAIGLVLAFRNNEAYRRLAEARDLFGKIIILSREIADSAVQFLKPEDDGQPSEVAYTVCRYMAIFGWVFKARLRDGEDATDVMRAVLPEEDVRWLVSQRSPAISVLAYMRKLLHEQYESGRCAAHLHFKFEEHLSKLHQACGGCERLFSSPIPPTMTRHVVRSLALWLLAMPLALVGSMPPAAIIGFTFAMSYVFIGIEELGIQVEQPFDILPLWQICHLATRNVEEAVVLSHHSLVLPLFNYTSPIWDEPM